MDIWLSLGAGALVVVQQLRTEVCALRSPAAPGSRCVTSPVGLGSAVFSEVVLRHNTSQGLKFGGTGCLIYPSPPFTLLLIFALRLSGNEERKPRGGLGDSGVHPSPCCLPCTEAPERAGSVMSLPWQRAFTLNLLFSDICYFLCPDTAQTLRCVSRRKG